MLPVKLLEKNVKLLEECVPRIFFDYFKYVVDV